MPHQPERPPAPEQQPPYYSAACFPTKQAAEQPYFAIQDIIHTMDCDLSAYRFLRQWQEPNTPPWYVVVIGEQPAPPVAEQITAVLNQGAIVPVPQEALAYLYSRRIEKTQEGPWVEHHYTVSVQRRNPKKDKLKRKAQEQSRRRNRRK